MTKRENQHQRTKQHRQPQAQPQSEESTAAPDFVIGRHPALAAVKSEQAINKVFIQEGLKADILADIATAAKKRGIIVQTVPKQKLDLLTDHANHQGVAIGAAAFEYATVDDILAVAKAKEEPPFVLILDNIEDPHNLGSIMRTADAAGVHGIIIPKRRAVGLTGTVAKTSTGAIEHVKVARVTNLVQTVAELKKAGLWIFGTDMKGKDYRGWAADGAVGLIIGNEGKGISPLLKKSVDEMLTIPMIGHVQSLNASVAASLLIYQGYNSRHPLEFKK